MVKSVRILEAGHCYHPEAIILPGSPLGKQGRFPASVAVIEHAREGIVLFDTGYSTDFDRITARFPENLYRLMTPVTISEETTAKAQLKRLGIAPGDVKHIVLSHLHADHAGGARDFSKAAIHFDTDAYRYYTGLTRFMQVKNGFLRALLPDDVESRARAIGAATFIPGDFGLGAISQGHDLFRDGSVIAVPLPGHMAGHLGLLVQTESGARKLFVGDAAWRKRSFQENRLPSAVTRLIIHDWKKYARTLAELHALHLKHPELEIIPCHCEGDAHDA